MTGVLDREQKFRLNHFDLVVPDGQPLRGALNALHRADLPDRVYGPNLTLRVCAKAAAEALLYFSWEYDRDSEIAGVVSRTQVSWPDCCGMEPFTRSAKLSNGETVR